jgi:ubiquinone/menaquinone biosynthesis C-methylase UbiE
MEDLAIFEIFSGLPRQGPGSDECTEKAFRSLPNFAAGARVLDIGCGGGMQTLHLARICENCQIIALDIYRPYLKQLMTKALKEEISDRIETVCASMEKLPLKDKKFDVIWAEGSIFVMGFGKGLEYWKGFLKDSGFMALTEAALFTDTPSEEVMNFWQDCYPDIKTIPENERIIEGAGYNIISKFKLPVSAWWDDFYAYLGKRLDEIEGKYRKNEEAKSVIDFSRTEIELFRKYPNEYGYVFFVLEKNKIHNQNDLNRPNFE